MGIFAPSVEKRTQLFFRDDGRFRFIKRPLKFSCFVQEDNNVIIKAWKHFYGAQIAFPGYKGIPADMVTMAFDRDVILDPFDKIPKGDSLGEKPDLKKKDSLKTWIAAIATNQRYIYRAKRESTTLVNKIVWTEIIVIIMMLIFWGIRFALVK